MVTRDDERRLEDLPNLGQGDHVIYVFHLPPDEWVAGSGI